jgi:regulator of cell morphogenesis and NO signaling
MIKTVKQVNQSGGITMTQTFTESSIIGNIVTEFPKASDFFKANRIDFCCGGNRPLIEAIEERNLSAEEILSELNALYDEAKKLSESTIDWNQASSNELIQYIVGKHHRYLNEELPKLSPYVTKVLRVHGAQHPHLAQIHKLFHQLKTELEQHTIKEETEDFPALIAFEEKPTSVNKEKVLTILSALEDEHQHAGDLIKEIRKVTNDFTPPPGACGTYRLVYQRLEELESDLFEHIHLENNILFPRAAQTI